jgi:hypothetical protein
MYVDGQSAGQMVVTGSCETQDPDLFRFSIAHSRCWSQLAERLQGGSDVRSRYAVVAVPTLGFDAEQPTLNEFRQVTARCLRSHIGAKSQFAGGKSAPIEQRQEHDRASRVSNERRHPRKASLHVHKLSDASVEHYGADRNIGGLSIVVSL